MEAPADCTTSKRAKAEETVTTSVTTETAEAAVDFSVIYFPFKGTSLTESEEGKALQILDIQNDHSDMKVTVTGWCDTKGSQEVNERYLLRRAETIKNWLVE